MSYKRVFGAKTRKVAMRKPAKWWFWRVFAWRPFAPPGKDTTNSSRKRNAWNVEYFRVAGRKSAKIVSFRHLAGFRVVPFRVFARRGERSPRENPLNGDFGGFSHGDLSPRQAKIRQTGGEKATHEKCHTFVWRGDRSPCENTKTSPFGGYSRDDLSPQKHERSPRENPQNSDFVVSNGIRSTHQVLQGGACWNSSRRWKCCSSSSWSWWSLVVNYIEIPGIISVIFFWFSGVIDCLHLKIEFRSCASNKTEASFFPCRLCFLGAFPFLS